MTKPRRKQTDREFVLERYWSARLFKRMGGGMYGIWIKRRGMWVILDSNLTPTARQAWADAAARINKGGKGK